MPARAIAEVPLEDFNESINIMIHAWPGQGKTVFGASAPNASLWSAEPGAISAKRQGSQAGLVKIRTWEEAQAALLAAEEGQFEHRDWIIVDTVSTVQRKNLNSVLDRAVAENPKRDPDIPAIQDYQKNQNSFSRWMERMVDLPINCIFLAHTMRVENQDGDTIYLPSITGGPDKGYPIANYCMALMNVVGYMEVRSVKGGESKETRRVRRVLFQPYHDAAKDIRYTAKDQFDCLGMFMDDPTVPDILKLIEESGTGSKPTKTAPVKRAGRRVANNKE